MKLVIRKRGQYWALLWSADGKGWRTAGVYRSREGANDALLAAKEYGVG